MHESFMKPHTQQGERTKQVKLTVDTGLALAFKEECLASGVSMAAVLTQFMAEYVKLAPGRKPTPDYTTRRRRVSALKAVTRELEQIKAAEERSRDNTPTNFLDTENYERTEEIIDILEQTLEILMQLW